MSYAIVRVQKMTTGSVRGIQIHDQREKDHSHSNPDIDFEKTQDNYDLHNIQKINFGGKVKGRIQELTLPRAVRKDAIVLCQFLVTSDKPFFDRLPKEQQDAFFKEGFNFIKDRYGERNIISANVHLDEKTPHLHVNFVPVTQDGRLCAKDLFKRNDLVKLHDDFWKFCNVKGFDLDRGESTGERKQHLTVEEFKLETKKQELVKTKEELKQLQEIKTNVKVDVEKGALGYSTKDVEELKKLAEAQQLEKYALKNTIRQQENTIVNLKNNLQMAEKKSGSIETLSSELERLKSENIALQNYLNAHPAAMKELERHVSFKKQVYDEGKALAKWKEYYVELSSFEVKHYKDIHATKSEYDKTLASMTDLGQSQKNIEGLNRELAQLQIQRQEIGKVSVKYVLKGSERRRLDDSIGNLEKRLKSAVDDLQRVYGITPDKINSFRNNLLHTSKKLDETINEQGQTTDKLQMEKTKTLGNYKLYKAKTGLYSEPYRNIVAELIKGIKADFKADRALNTLSKDDRQVIYNKLPEGLRERFAIQERKIAEKPISHNRGIEI